MKSAKRKNEAVVEALKQLPAKDRHLVLVWSQRAIAIRNDPKTSTSAKIKKLSRLRNGKIAQKLILGVARTLKVKLWDERGWPMRLALSGLVVGAAISGGEGAGVAALGSAIGLPFYLLTASGGALLGTIFQELAGSTKKKRTQSRSSTKI